MKQVFSFYNPPVATDEKVIACFAQVLGTRRLMHITFDEFEKTMALAHNVFQTWDDEYEKVYLILKK